MTSETSSNPIFSSLQDVLAGVPRGGGGAGDPVAAGRGGHGGLPLARPPLHPHLRLRVLPQVQGRAAQGVPQGPQEGATGGDTREEARLHRLGGDAPQQVRIRFSQASVSYVRIV